MGAIFGYKSLIKEMEKLSEEFNSRINDFDFDGLDDDSEGHKDEPLIKSIINKSVLLIPKWKKQLLIKLF